MRVRGVISYDGSQFFGFQSQRGEKRTVVGELQRALRALGIESQIVGSGRTDRGVHASAQVVHFDLPPYWEDLQRLRHSLNHRLHPAIHFRRIDPVPEDFHARYWAKRRAYRYILAHPSLFSPFQGRYVTFASYDLQAIAQAIPLFQGTHDFSLFHKRGSDPKGTIRTIYKATTYRYRHYLVLYFEANGFLRGQVRMMVAALLALSQGKLQRNQIERQLAGVERAITTLAPPQGLYLCRVLYGTKAALM
ncbi:MAG: tRNA pseudouridine(38-40) synthase TruA [Nitratiruptor sp.]|nr:tRNA pseudouridine(38-40) synthase TruA [Nitratiruptor sp.]NPA83901.1 tRNA pseudouridine(38-40) synthase TruA [Campylobacterota bacterium]